MLLLVFLAFFAFSAAGCGSDSPGESAEAVADEMTGKTPIDRGRRMKQQIEGIRDMREDQAEEAAAGE